MQARKIKVEIINIIDRGENKTDFHFLDAYSNASFAEKKLSPLSCFIVIFDTLVLDIIIKQSQMIIPT